MKFKNTYGILMITFFLCGCNNHKAIEKVDRFESSTINNESLEELATKNLLNSQELIRLLPAKLQGMPLINTEPNGKQTIIGTYSNHADPNYTSTAIIFTLVDGAGDIGLKHIKAIHNLLNQDLNQSSDKGWVKTTIHNQQKIMVKEQTKTENTGIKSTVTSSIDMIKNHRFHINLTARHLPGNQLIRAIDEVTNLSFPE